MKRPLAAKVPLLWRFTERIGFSFPEVSSSYHEATCASTTLSTEKSHHFDAVHHYGIRKASSMLQTTSISQMGTWVLPDRSMLRGRAGGVFIPVRLGSTEKAPAVRPSITWGVVGDKEAQKEGREQVLEFLKREGINTDEFGSVELPTSIDVMAERLDFVKNMGLETKHINEYPLMICCSVKKNMVPVVNYLEALGFTSSNLTKFLQKYPMILHASVTIDIQPVIIYLMGLGVMRLKIPEVLLKYPDMLGFRIEGTMSTSIGYLVSIGMEIREVGTVVTQFPEILGMRVGNNIKPKVDYLCSFGLPREAVGKIIEKHPRLLGCELDDIKERVNQLVKVGVHLDAVPAIITHYPKTLLAPTEKKIKKKSDWLTRELKISSKDVPRVIEKMPQILDLNEKYAHRNVNYLSKAGFKMEDVGKMVVMCPQILIVDLNNWMKPSLEYFKKEMKRDLKELIEFPAYFTYGLEERIRFRYRRVAEKGLKWSLAWFLNCSNAAFQERIAGAIKESDKPEKQFIMGGAVELIEPANMLSTSTTDNSFSEETEDSVVGV